LHNSPNYLTRCPVEIFKTLDGRDTKGNSKRAGDAISNRSWEGEERQNEVKDMLVRRLPDHRPVFMRMDPVIVSKGDI
jgi:hypothetical protein